MATKKLVSSSRAGLVEATQLAFQKLRASAILSEDLTALGLDVLDGGATARLGTHVHPVSSIKINYHDSRGKATGFYRVRYLGQLPGVAGLAAKPQRYAQAPNSLNGVYLAKCFDWPSVLKDPSKPLLVTEGEFKALAGCLHGLPVIGLGGVDVWQSKRHGYDLLPQLKEFEWRGREVVVVYDSDLAEKADVQRALIRFCEKFSFELGARPSVVFLNPGSAGEKLGLDDLIARRGIKYTKDVLNETQPYVTAQALLEMNERFVYVRSPGIVIDAQDDDLQVPVDAFKSHVFANAYYYKQKPDGNLVRASLAKDWIEWPFRRELRRLVFRPGEPREVDGCYNTFDGWAVEPQAGSVKLWGQLLDYLFEGVSAEGRRWFERWCAYPLQHPGTKMYTAAVVTGRVHGTGKSLVGFSLMQVYGRKFSCEIGPGELTDADNAWAHNKLFVLGNEVTGSDKRQEADRIKNLITQERMRINIKYIPKYEIEDFINYYLTSNHADAFYLEDTDRRFFVHDVRHLEPLDRAFYVEYVKWVKSAEGKAALFHYLRHLPLGDFDPAAPAPDTEAKRKMISIGRGDLSAFVRDDLATGHGGFPVVFRADDVAKWYEGRSAHKVGAQAVSRELARSGAHRVNDGKPVRHHEKLVRLWTFDPVLARSSKADDRARLHEAFEVCLQAKF